MTAVDRLVAWLAGPPRRVPIRPRHSPTIPPPPPRVPSNVSPIERRPRSTDHAKIIEQIDYLRDMHGDARALEILREFTAKHRGH